MGLSTALNFHCAYLSNCSGCSEKILDFEQQCVLKTRKFKSTLLENFNVKGDLLSFQFPTQGYHRHRGDFICFDNQMGLYDSSRNLIPLESCSLLDPQLNEFYQTIKDTPFQVKKGTIRIRKSVDSQFGVWLDFSNLDIKRLLEEGKTLNSLLQQGVVVEMGQKGKRLNSINGKLKLSEPKPEAWFKTLINRSPTPLFSLISSFTQPSFELNLLIQMEIQKFLSQKRFDSILEFGTGVGNFGLFLSAYSEKLIFLETDERNLIPLRKNIQTYLTDKDLKVSSSKNSIEAELIFVNPPKSGVGPLFDNHFPDMTKDIIYVSCYLESMIHDLKKLAHQGFQFQRSILFDQFPQSNHFETITYLSR